MTEFVHLHLHTEFSMLDGAARIADVVATAAAEDTRAVLATLREEGVEALASLPWSVGASRDD